MLQKRGWMDKDARCSSFSRSLNRSLASFIISWLVCFGEKISNLLNIKVLNNVLNMLHSYGNVSKRADFVDGHRCAASSVVKSGWCYNKTGEITSLRQDEY